MPTQLTTPVVETVTAVTIEQWCMQMRYNANLSLDATSSIFEIIVADRKADGSLKKNRNVQLRVSELTAPQIATLRAFHAQVTAFARSVGLLPAGNDTNDL